MRRNVELRFGAMYPPIKEQLNKQGLALDDDKGIYEKIRNAINMVRIHGFASEKETDSMYKRLMREISARVSDMEENVIC